MNISRPRAFRSSRHAGRFSCSASPASRFRPWRWRRRRRQPPRLRRRSPLPSTPSSRRPWRHASFRRASVTVVKDGAVVLAKGYGFSDVERSSKGHRADRLPARLGDQAVHGNGDPDARRGRQAVAGRQDDPDPARPARRLGTGYRPAPPQPHVRYQELHRRVRREESAGQPGLHPRRDPRPGQARGRCSSRLANALPTATPATTCSE